MLVTRKADYGIRCLLQLAQNPDRIFSTSELAPAIQVSEAFTAKVLQGLARGGLVKSERGSSGGFRLARAPQDISLLAALEVLQGPLAINACISHQDGCTMAGTCAVHPIWRKLRCQIEAQLRGLNFATLVADTHTSQQPHPCSAFPSREVE